MDKNNRTMQYHTREDVFEGLTIDEKFNFLFNWTYNLKKTDKDLATVIEGVNQFFLIIIAIIIIFMQCGFALLEAGSVR